MIDHLETANLLSGLPAPARATLAAWLRIAPERPSTFERLSRTPQAGAAKSESTPAQDAALAAWRASVALAVADRLGHLLAPLTADLRAALAGVLENEPPSEINARVLQKLAA